MANGQKGRRALIPVRLSGVRREAFKGSKKRHIYSSFSILSAFLPRGDVHLLSL
jgi:hypothetical protein